MLANRFPVPNIRALASTLCLLVPCLLAMFNAQAQWETLQTSDGTQATKRHEAASAVVDGKLYLFGGRGERPVEEFDPAARQWRNLGGAPGELHHFQPAVVGSKIYIVAAFKCCYPGEPVVETIHVFDTVSETWDTAGTLPAGRVRGSAATVVHDGKIYLVGGNPDGHRGGGLGWFDEFDPATGNWSQLPDMPHGRDHAQATLAGNLLVVAGGRSSTYPNPFKDPVRETDIFNFKTGQWRTEADIPTPRAGAVTVHQGRDVIVAGGEIDAQSLSDLGIDLDDTRALATVEAFNLDSGQWRTLPSMLDGRHSGGGSIIDETLHMVAGSLKRGGSPETSKHETLDLTGLTSSGGTDGSSSSGTSSAGTAGSSTSGTTSSGSTTSGTDGGTDGSSDTGGTDGSGSDGSDGSADGGSEAGSSGSGNATQGATESGAGDAGEGGANGAGAGTAGQGATTAGQPGTVSTGSSSGGGSTGPGFLLILAFWLGVVPGSLRGRIPCVDGRHHT